LVQWQQKLENTLAIRVIVNLGGEEEILDFNS
jgi:hypothetical protein